MEQKPQVTNRIRSLSIRDGIYKRGYTITLEMVETTALHIMFLNKIQYNFKRYNSFTILVNYN